MSKNIYRTGTLIEKRYRRLIIPRVSASLIKSLMVLVDSVVAGRYIGTTALAAIALAAPVLAIDEMLHCLLGSGLSLQVANAVGEGCRKKADRMVGATIVAVLIGYILVFLPIIVFIKPILSFFSEDTELFDLSCRYIIPLIISFPIFEAMLCLERAYMIDGRESFFASRSIISSVINIVFDIVLVTVFDIGMVGLALASIISTLLGYCITLSHGLSDRCTVHPDFSVILNPSEAIRYVKDNLIRGVSFAIDEGSQGLIETLIFKVLATQGGVVALAAWGVFLRIKNILNTCNLGVTVGLQLLGGTLYSEGDIKGCRTVFHQSFHYILIISSAIMMSTILFAPQILQLLNIEYANQDLCSGLIRFASPSLLFGSLVMFVLSSSIILEQYSFSVFGKIAERILIVVCVLGGSFFHAEGVMIGYVSAEILSLVILICFVRTHSNMRLLNMEKSELKDYSIILEPEQIVQASVDAQNYLIANAYPVKIARMFAIFVEEGSNLIRMKNPGQTVRADIRISIRENRLVLTIVDDGMPYNISSEKGWNHDPDTLEDLILTKLSDNVAYDRFLNLNHLIISSNYHKQTAIEEDMDGHFVG